MKIEIRSAAEAVVEGYVNAVGRDSRVLCGHKGRFVEQVTPKTFEKAISGGKDIELRYNHDKRLGSVLDKNLTLYEDNIGLYAKALITDTDIIAKAKSGELRGWSFGFSMKADRWENASEGLLRRYLDDLELREVSILDKTPAYIGTSIEMRGEEVELYELREINETVLVEEKASQGKSTEKTENETSDSGKVNENPLSDVLLYKNISKYLKQRRRICK